MNLNKEEIKEAVKSNNGIDVEVLDENDEFLFNCNRCGCCCKGYRSDIILNPFDLYQMVKALNLSWMDVILNYCDYYIGKNSRIPIVVLDHQKSNGWCHFLEFDANTRMFGCKINNHKPGACRMHPLGLVRQCLDGKTYDYKYILTQPCEYSDRTPQKISEWMETYNKTREEYDVSFAFLNQIHEWINLDFLADIIEEKKTKEVEELKQNLPGQSEFEVLKNLLTKCYMSIMMQGLYGYDAERPFLEQIEENKTILKEKLEQLIEANKLIDLDLTPVKKENK